MTQSIKMSDIYIFLFEREASCTKWLYFRAQYFPLIRKSFKYLYYYHCLYGTQSTSYCFILIIIKIEEYCFIHCAIKIRKEIEMDKSELLSTLDSETKSSKNKANKLKWREIEAIHDRKRLKQELRELGMSPEDDLKFL